MNRIASPFFVLLIALGAMVSAQEQEQNSDVAGERPTLPTQSSESQVIPDVPKGAGTGKMGLIWSVPEHWIQETPTSSMRRAQYQLPGEDGAGECVVFYFGPGQGGEPEANVHRWADQFIQPDGRMPREALLIDPIEVNGIPVLLSEISGTYVVGRMMGGARTQHPDYMLLGAIASGPDANWFFKLTGPKATIEANRTAFRSMIHSIQPGE